MENEKFIEKIEYKDFVNLILHSEKRIVYCSINLHEELAIALTEASKKGIQVTVFVDASEDNYRNGYGDFKSIDELRRVGIQIYEIKGNNISFIIVDDKGLFIFPQSRIFSSDPIGPNAILMDKLTQLKLISHYFPPKSKQEREKLVDQAIELHSASKFEINQVIDDIEAGKTDIEIQKLDFEKLEVTKENLRINPPLHPDLKRKINTYTTKIQFVELKFAGSEFHISKIKIPRKALPIQNAKLVELLETKMRLFNDIENNEDLKRLGKIKEKEDKLRSESLIPIKSRGKSLIKVKDKKKFVNELSKIQADVENYKKSATNKIEDEILNAKKMLKYELTSFLKTNPPDAFKKFEENTLFNKIEDFVQTVISKINFPDSTKFLSKLELTCNFYDLTFEDFKDVKLLEEFKEKKILKSDELDDIVSIQKAFETAK